MNMRTQQREIERRCIGEPPEPFALREEGGVTRIEGYAVVYNSPAHGEMVAPTAFKKSLSGKRDILALLGHDPNMPLGRRSNGKLVLRNDERGLWFSVEPNPETSWGRDALAAVQRGDITGVSFGFRVRPGGIGNAEVDGQELAVLKDLELIEVSPVAFPWYEDTTATARDADGADPTDELTSLRLRLELEAAE